MKLKEKLAWEMVDSIDRYPQPIEMPLTLAYYYIEGFDKAKELACKLELNPLIIKTIESIGEKEV
jgi:hypothetical protein